MSETSYSRQIPIGMDQIADGVARFKKSVFPRRRLLFEHLAKSQAPKALFVTCTDSRIVPSLITRTNPGGLFIERNPGNICPVYSAESVGVSASIEYAVLALNVPHVIICGHSDCGAVKGILHPDTTAELPALGRWLSHGTDALRLMREFGTASDSDAQDLLGQCNVIVQMRNLLTHPSVQSRMRAGNLMIHGWYYRIPTGQVLSYDSQTKQFLPWPD
jgi:carbonic anhydrase